MITHLQRHLLISTYIAKKKTTKLHNNKLRNNLTSFKITNIGFGQINCETKHILELRVQKTHIARSHKLKPFVHNVPQNPYISDFHNPDYRIRKFNFKKTPDEIKIRVRKETHLESAETINRWDNL
jgi:hypothetical protein